MPRHPIARTARTTRRFEVECLEERCVLSRAMPLLTNLVPLTLPAITNPAPLAASLSTVVSQTVSSPMATVTSGAAPVIALTAPSSGGLVSNLVSGVTNTLQSVTAPVTSALSGVVAPLGSVANGLVPTLLNTVGQVAQTVTSGLGLTSIVQIQPENGGLAVSLLGGSQGTGSGIQVSINLPNTPATGGSTTGGVSVTVGTGDSGSTGTVVVGVGNGGVVIGAGENGAGAPTLPVGGNTNLNPPSASPLSQFLPTPAPTGFELANEEAAVIVPTPLGTPAPTEETLAPALLPAALSSPLALPRAGDEIPAPIGLGDEAPVALSITDGATSIPVSDSTSGNSAAFWEQFGKQFTENGAGPVAPFLSVDLSAWGQAAVNSLEHLKDLGSLGGMGYVSWAMALASVALACELARRRAAQSWIAQGAEALPPC
jgi:hypothetical protein